MSASPVVNPNSGGQQVIMGFNSLTGQLMWNNTYTWLGLVNNRYAVGAGYLIQINMGTLTKTAIDLNTGAIVWDGTPTEAPWGMYTGMGINAYGMSYQGSYSGSMQALDLKTGQQVWSFNAGVSGEQTPYTSWPMFNGPTVGGHIVYCGYSEHTPNTPLYTGAHLYALDAATGKQVWRSKAHQVREEIGISADGSRIYAKCMNDTVFAFSSTAPEQKIVWAAPCMYGYNIDASMIREKDGTVFLGTKNGRIYALDAVTGEIRWAHRTGTSIISTPTPLDARHVVVTTFDGIVALLSAE